MTTNSDPPLTLAHRGLLAYLIDQGAGKGQMIPLPTREATEELNISASTLRRLLSVLSEHGLIRVKPGLGSGRFTQVQVLSGSLSEV